MTICENGKWNIVIHWPHCQYRIILPGFVRIRCARIAQTTFIVCLRHLFIHFRHLVLVLAQLISSTGKGFVVARRDDYLKHHYDDLLIIRIQLFWHRQHAVSCSPKSKKKKSLKIMKRNDRIEFVRLTQCQHLHELRCNVFIVVHVDRFYWRLQDFRHFCENDRH